MLRCWSCRSIAMRFTRPHTGVHCTGLCRQAPARLPSACERGASAAPRPQHARGVHALAGAAASAAAAPRVEEVLGRTQAEGRPEPEREPDGTAGPLLPRDRPERASHKKERVPPALVARGAAFNADVWHNAVVLVDKPDGWSSSNVCSKLRGVMRVKKIGHAGTLDPRATGLLILCTGAATKGIEAHVLADKEYTGTLRLGQATATYDAEVEPCEELPWEHITDEDLERARQGFVGAIRQRPPMFSALKVGGERLYAKARRGEVVEVKEREVTISRLELSRPPGGRDVVFRVGCSKGTYIRSLVNDLGRAAGTAAYMLTLRRERIGQHCVDDAWPLADLIAAAHAARGVAASPAPS